MNDDVATTLVVAGLALVLLAGTVLGRSKPGPEQDVDGTSFGCGMVSAGLLLYVAALVVTLVVHVRLV